MSNCHLAFQYAGEIAFNCSQFIIGRARISIVVDLFLDSLVKHETIPTVELSSETKYQGKKEHDELLEDFSYHLGFVGVEFGKKRGEIILAVRISRRRLREKSSIVVRSMMEILPSRSRPNSHWIYLNKSLVALWWASMLPRIRIHVLQKQKKEELPSTFSSSWRWWCLYSDMTWSGDQRLRKSSQLSWTFFSLFSVTSYSTLRTWEPFIIVFWFISTFYYTTNENKKFYVFFATVSKN